MLRRACHTAMVALPWVAATQAAERRPQRVFRCTGGAESLHGAVLQPIARLPLYVADYCVCWPGVVVNKKLRARGTSSLRAQGTAIKIDILCSHDAGLLLKATQAERWSCWQRCPPSDNGSLTPRATRCALASISRQHALLQLKEQ